MDDKVAELVIDQHLTARERHPDQVFLPLALSRSDALFDYLAAMLVLGHLAKVLNDGLVDHGTPFIGL